MNALTPWLQPFFFLWIRTYAALLIIRGLRETMRPDALVLLAFVFAAILLPSAPLFLSSAPLFLSSAPLFLPSAPPVAVSYAPGLVFRAFSEAVTGILIAAPLALVCECFAFAGRFSDVFRGAHQAEQQLPSL